jgi:hypothetical protein
MLSLNLVDKLFFDKDGKVKDSDTQIDKSCYVQVVVKDMKISLKVFESVFNSTPASNTDIPNTPPPDSSAASDPIPASFPSGSNTKVSLEIDNISEDLSKFSIDDVSKKEIVQLVSEHIPGKSEEYYATCSSIVMISLFHILSREFNSPPFSEELIVKISISQSIWKPLFVKYWSAWSQTISRDLENKKPKSSAPPVMKEKIVSTSSDDEDDLQANKESQSQRDFQSIFEEGGKEFPVIVEIINRIKADDSKKEKKDSTEPRIVEVGSEPLKPPDATKVPKSLKSFKSSNEVSETDTNVKASKALKSSESKAPKSSKSKTARVEDSDKPHANKEKDKKLKKTRKTREDTPSAPEDALETIDLSSFSGRLEMQVYILSELVKKLLKK